MYLITFNCTNFAFRARFYGTPSYTASSINTNPYSPPPSVNISGRVATPERVPTPTSSSVSVQQTITPTQNVAVTIAMAGGANITVPITSLVAQSQGGK